MSHGKVLRYSPDGPVALDVDRFSEGNVVSDGEGGITVVPTGMGGATGPTGPTGPMGPAGPTGPTGPFAHTIGMFETPTVAGTFALTVPCAAALTAHRVLFVNPLEGLTGYFNIGQVRVEANGFLFIAGDAVTTEPQLWDVWLQP